jgi:hypothetical protein
MLRAVSGHLQPRPTPASSASPSAAGRTLECRDCTGNLWRLAIAQSGSGSLSVLPSSHGLSTAAAPLAFPLPAGSAKESDLYGLCDDNAGAIWFTDGAGLWRLDPRRSQGGREVSWVEFDVPAAVPMRELELQLLEEGPLLTNLHQCESGHAVCGIQPSTRIPAGKTEAEAYAHHALSIGPEGEFIAQSIHGVNFAAEWGQGPRLPFGNHDIHATVCNGKPL